MVSVRREPGPDSVPIGRPPATATSSLTEAVESVTGVSMAMWAGTRAGAVNTRADEAAARLGCRATGRGWGAGGGPGRAMLVKIPERGSASV